MSPKITIDELEAMIQPVDPAQAVLTKVRAITGEVSDDELYAARTTFYERKGAAAFADPFDDVAWTEARAADELLSAFQTWRSAMRTYEREISAAQERRSKEQG